MADKTFIFQGPTPNTHADAIRDLFALPEIVHAVLSIAFVDESGVQIIESQLRAHASQLTVYAGIRNDITSYQALSLLLEIGATLYTVDTGARTVVFHPKLYLVRTKTRARMVITSANLTLGGMNNNIEAGILLDMDISDQADKALVTEIESQLETLPKNYPQHVAEVTSASALDELLSSGRLVDEMALPPPRPGTSALGNIGKDVTPRIKLKPTPLHRKFANPKPISGTSGYLIDTEEKSEPIPPASEGVELDLVWESKQLARRDLQIPTASRTNPTGSISLDKGLLPGDIDHRHYFRDEVFHYLQWANGSRSNELASADFHLVIKGISYGEFQLTIAHSTSITSRSYLQHNATTSLRWGPARKYIAREDLIGRTLALYRDRADPSRFTLEID